MGKKVIKLNKNTKEQTNKKKRGTKDFSKPTKNNTKIK
jgi:hypothetical protein